MRTIKTGVLLIIFGAATCNVFSQDSSAIYYAHAKEIWINNIDDSMPVALGYMNRVVAINSTDTAYTFRAVIKYLCQDFQGAVSDLGEAIRLKPDSPEYYIYRAQFRVPLGDVTSEIDDYTASIKLNPRSGGYMQLADIELGRGQYEDAIENETNQIKAGLKDTDFNYYPYLYRGWAKFYLKDYSGALKDLDSSDHYGPNNPITYDYIATVKLAMGMREEACEDYIRAKTVNGTHKFDIVIEKYCKK